MAQQTLNELYEIIKNRKVQPKEGSYTNYLSLQRTRTLKN